MTEDWELNFNTETCDNCYKLYCTETGITKKVHTGYNTQRTFHYCGVACQNEHHLKRLREGGI